MTSNWLRVVVTSCAEAASAVDEAVEEAGLRHVVHDGEAWDAYIVCETDRDLVATRLAFPEGLVANVTEEALHMRLHDVAQADLARAVLRETPSAKGEVRMVRHLRIYARDQRTYRAIRAEVAARVAAGGAAVALV